jgi:hypothetical protein
MRKQASQPRFAFAKARDFVANASDRCHAAQRSIAFAMD